MNNCKLINFNEVNIDKSKYLRSDLRSLEMHKLIAKKILEKPELIQIAVGNIARWKIQNNFSQPYLDEWLSYINSGIIGLTDFMVCETGDGQRLRSSTPFPGILSDRELIEIFNRFKNEP